MPDFYCGIHGTIIWQPRETRVNGSWRPTTVGNTYVCRTCLPPSRYSVDSKGRLYMRAVEPMGERGSR